MSLKTGIALFFALFLIVVAQILKAQAKFEKQTFYKALASEDAGQIDAQLKILEGINITHKEAYAGALLMKKAGLTAGLKERLSLFKSGHKSLESAINKDEKNFEYRFLRLIIQENAPRILSYHRDIEKDSKYIRENFKNQSPFIKNEIIDYSQKSKAIKPQDFQ